MSVQSEYDRTHRPTRPVTPNSDGEERKREKAVKAMQFRTQLDLIERRVFALQAHLRYSPQDTAARQELDGLTEMYRSMLAGTAA